MNRSFTKDEIKILISHTDFFYDQCIKAGEKFEGKDKYEIVKEVLDVIKRNEVKKTELRLIK